MEVLTVDEIQNLYRPPKTSHKGQNGKLLVIGGSKLFHAAAFWSAAVASRIVDLVHFSSPAMENNDLMRKKAKEKFWDGIVVPWEKVEEYVDEDDCILMGPGMPRDEGLQKGERPTGEIVDTLLRKYRDKRWVLDGGALQEVNPSLLNNNMIITPHKGEWKRILGKSSKFPPIRRTGKVQGLNDPKEQIKKFSQQSGCTVLLKGVEDVVCSPKQCRVVRGGNEGMTKGGTGDVLAGMVAALYCKNEAMLSAVAGSLINKRAGDELYKTVGPYFNAQDLVMMVPKIMRELLSY